MAEHWALYSFVFRYITTLLYIKVEIAIKLFEGILTHWNQLLKKFNGPFTSKLISSGHVLSIFSAYEFCPIVFLLDFSSLWSLWRLECCWIILAYWKFAGAFWLDRSSSEVQNMSLENSGFDLIDICFEEIVWFLILTIILLFFWCKINAETVRKKFSY